MPKVVRYTRGSVIYLEGDKNNAVFALQSGQVALTSTDVETQKTVSEQVSIGEFLGVRSAIGHFAREETATVISDAQLILLTASEFESLFCANKQLLMKMLRVFSNQLRTLHAKTEAILKSHGDVTDMSVLILEVAQSFYNDEQYRACCDICQKLLTMFPNSANKDAVNKLYENAKNHSKARGGVKQSRDLGAKSSMTADKPFSLPAFARFAKKYEAGSVIIMEYEQGNTFYLIQSGAVELTKCVNGTKKNLDILYPGEFFGEMAILENSPRSATCIAIDAVEVLEFNKGNFEALVTGQPQIALVLLKLFCKRIYDQRRRLRTLCTPDLSVRVADVFVMLDEMVPLAGGDSKHRVFNVNAQEVARWAGIPVDVAAREIKLFSTRHRLEVKGDSIAVLDIEDLRRTVETYNKFRH